MQIEKAFENENAVVVIKPHGSLSTPGRDPNDPRPCVGRELQKQMGQQIFPVHRLDFEVSGLLCFAKTPLAHRDMQKWFEASLVRKTYQALTTASGNFEFLSQWQDWRSKLAKGKKRAFEAPHGKESLTRARAVRQMENGDWLWELQPLTGRSHQLRFEMSKHGFPILGDQLYGGLTLSSGWIGLRATVLDFSALAAAARFDLPARLEASDLLRPPIELA